MSGIVLRRKGNRMWDQWSEVAEQQQNFINNSIKTQNLRKASEVDQIYEVNKRTLKEIDQLHGEGSSSVFSPQPESFSGGSIPISERSDIVRFNLITGEHEPNLDAVV